MDNNYSVENVNRMQWAKKKSKSQNKEKKKEKFKKIKQHVPTESQGWTQVLWENPVTKSLA